MSVIDDVYGGYSDGVTLELDTILYYVVETVEGSFQIFQSFTYGEMAIVGLLLTLVFLFAFKWIWEALR